jgi:hypothetical protein
VPQTTMPRMLNAIDTTRTKVPTCDQ